ncbi:hypothetical protein MW290_03750 [Aquincola tertiaricarbonis]|uniref:Uncharacterized protein n=1 Tax=Aquincola tertiaricarbonis TaxID=391953 RepID=A0ABY4S4W7_AQUTE|nr:hypothetical protein [Aquincola tertiaricarbonis]URI07735.1 hypothetical protein MW290_03750 [Aquincola tertiaricarbonis]
MLISNKPGRPGAALPFVNPLANCHCSGPVILEIPIGDNMTLLLSPCQQTVRQMPIKWAGGTPPQLGAALLPQIWKARAQASYVLITLNKRLAMSITKRACALVDKEDGQQHCGAAEYRQDKEDRLSAHGQQYVLPQQRACRLGRRHRIRTLRRSSPMMRIRLLR